MKKILFPFLILLGWQYYSQSPILSVPQYYRDVLNSTTILLPKPDPTNWNSGTYGQEYYGLDHEAYDGRPSIGGHNIMYDENGDLLFFVIDGTIFDKDGWIMDIMGDELNYGGMSLLGESQYVIVPHIKDCNKYFIIGSTFKSTLYNDIQTGYLPRNLRYTMLDLSQYNASTQRMGQIVRPTDGIDYGGTSNLSRLYPDPIPTSLSEYPDGTAYNPHYAGPLMALSPLNSSNKRFLYTFNGISVFKHIVDDNGITLDTDPSHNTVIYNGSGLRDDVYHFSYINATGKLMPSVYAGSEMEIIQLSNGNYRMAFPTVWQDGSGYPYDKVTIMDMDSDGNYISSSVVELDFTRYSNTTQATSFYGVKGLEFTSDGGLLYINKNTFDAADKSLWYYDFSNPGAGAQVYTHSMGSSYSQSQIELAENGYLYFANANGLGSISSPGSPTSNTFTNAHPLSIEPSTGGYDKTNFNSSAWFYTLPNQVDTEDWLARFQESCCHLSTGGSDGYTVTGTETWTVGSTGNPWGATGDVYLTGDLNIEAGADLTITGMTIHFTETGRVNIKKTGKLTVNSTVLTSRACEDLMWQGVRVWGDPGLSSSDATQGSFYFNNGSEISNAYIGVCNYNGSYQTGYPENQTYVGNPGGRIIANDSYFYNNSEDVHIYNYTYGNGTPYNFNNITFETNAALLNGDNPGSHVTLDDVVGVSFKGCDFINSTSGIYADGDRGMGITSEEAKFTVTFECNAMIQNPCPVGSRDYSTFTNLYQGIHAISPVDDRVATVKFCTFTDVREGIYLENVNNAVIVNDTFNNIGYTGSIWEFGLNMNSCTDYTVENNIFNGSSTTNPITTGILVNNSNDNGTADYQNDIYRNHFNDMKCGILAINENVQLSGGFPVTHKGLDIWCNEFNNSDRHDIAWDLGGIDNWQGNSTDPANNIFSDPTPYDGDLWNYVMTMDGSDYIYQVAYYHTDDIPSGGGYLEPQDYNVNTDLFPITGTFDYATNCPLHNFAGGIIIHRGQNVSLYDMYEQDLQEANAELINLAAVDESAQNNLYQYTAGTIDYQSFENNMIGLGSLINDNVLKSVLDLANQLPHQTIKNILLNNAPFSDELVSYIDNSSLSGGVKGQLIAFSNNNKSKANRKSKEESIAFAQVNAKRNVRYEIIEMMSDSLVSSEFLYSELKDFYSRTSSLDDKLRLIDLALANGDEKTVSITCDSLRGLNSTFLDDYCDFADMYLDAERTMNCVHDCQDSSLYNSLISFYDNHHGRLRSKAAALLSLYYGVKMDHEIPSEAFTKEKSMQLFSTEMQMNEEDNMIVYPNPSTGIVNILFEGVDNVNGVITVYDNLGKLIIRTTFAGSLGFVDLSDYQNGIYSIVVNTHNGESYAKRLVLE